MIKNKYPDCGAETYDLDACNCTSDWADEAAREIAELDICDNPELQAAIAKALRDERHELKKACSLLHSAPVLLVYQLETENEETRKSVLEYGRQLKEWAPKAKEFLAHNADVQST